MNTPDSTQLTWTQVYNDFKGALQGAADALKTGSEHVYEIIVRQQVINSISLIITYVFLFIFIGVAWKLTYKFYLRKTEEEKDMRSHDKGEWGALFIIPSVVTIATIITLGATMDTVITGFFNPEYGAIQEIKTFIK